MMSFYFNRHLRFALLAVVALLSAVPHAAAAGLRAGVAAVKITPSLTRTVYIAGYENNRVAESVHDDLWARTLVLDDGQARFAVVALDLVGLSNTRVRQIRESIRSVRPENVLITCTHVHSGPDTLGLWGPGFTKSGVDPLYMDRLQARIVASVETAVRDLRPATLRAGATEVPDGLVHNSRETTQDKQLTTLRLVDDKGATVGTVIHYGAHPEINKRKALTSDFVHYVREVVERRFGGVALYLNGALGGMVTPKISGHTWEEVQRVGEGVGKAAVLADERGERIENTRLGIQRKTVQLPLENSAFQIFLGAKVLEGKLQDGKVESEVWRVDIGRQISWITLPGEILPKPALELKSRMPGRYRMVVALGNDELGYILDPEDWPKDRYKYERTMSLGPKTWPVLLEAAKELLR